MGVISTDFNRRPLGGLRVALLLLTLSPWCVAQTKPKPPAECRVQLSVVEQSPERLSVRARTSCPVAREQLRAALMDVAPSAFAGGAQPAELRVELGRIIEHPWLSTALARAALSSKEWDKARGAPRQRNINQLAGALLRLGGTLDDLPAGWTLKSVSVEKVLVQPARAMPELRAAPGDKALVPFDAQVWLQYVPSNAAVAAPPAAPTVIPPARLDE